MPSYISKVRVLLLGGPFDRQDIYLDKSDLEGKVLVIQHATYRVVEGCASCEQDFCLRWEPPSDDRECETK